MVSPSVAQRQYIHTAVHLQPHAGVDWEERAGGNTDGAGVDRTARVTEAATATATTNSNGLSPGVLAGSVVGVAALGAVVILLMILLMGYVRKKKASALKTPGQDDMTFNTVNQGAYYNRVELPAKRA